MAKVLIAPLGTGSKYSQERDSEMESYKPSEYKTAKYKLEGESHTYETSFVASALSKHLKIDKLFLIGTRKSMWDEVYRYFAEKSGLEMDESYWMELSEKVEKSAHDNRLYEKDFLEAVNQAIDKQLEKYNDSGAGGSKSFLMDYGLNEEELWENFDLFMEIADILEDGDQVYLDITHSFRSIPIFMYLMLEFIQTLNDRNIELKGIYYGMLEASREKGYSPIVDLSPIFEISKWIRGTYDFINYGNGYLMGELVKDKEIKKKLINISDLVSINYIADFRTQVKSLEKLLEKSDKNSLRVFKYMAPKLEQFTSRFSKLEKDSDFQVELSKWYFENKRYGHGYICLVESILTKLCELYGLDINEYENREMMKHSVVYNGKKIEIIRNEVHGKYVSINKIRNRIAHASLNEDGKNGIFRTDIDMSQKHVEDISNIMNKLDNSDLTEKFTLEEIKLKYEEKKKGRK